MAYLPPGVYSQFNPNPANVVLGVGARVPAIIGTGITYSLVENEEVTRNSGYPYSSSQTDNLDYEATEIVGVGSARGLKDYVENTDYELTDEGDIKWLGTDNEPDPGDTYYVTYKKDKSAADYLPKVKFRESEVFSEYGQPYQTNTLSLGAEIMFDNGAPFVITVQVTEDNNAAFQTAIDELKKEVEGIDPTVIVPLSTSSTIHSYIKSHVYYMSSRDLGKPRMCVLGMPVGSSQADVKSRAEAMGVAVSQNDGGRVILNYDEPKREVLQTDGTYEEKTLSSIFAAAAVGGMLCSLPVQEPLTRKTVNGFTEFTKARDWLNTEKNLLAEKGVWIYNDKNGIVTVRHQITTDTRSTDFNEASITQLRDYVDKNVNDQLEKTFVGGYETENTEENMELKIDATLESIRGDGIIIGYGGITATQDASNPTNYNVEYWFDAADPINRIFVKYSIVTS